MPCKKIDLNILYYFSIKNHKMPFTNTEIESDVHNKISLYQACIELFISDWERESKELNEECFCARVNNLKEKNCPSCKKEKQQIYNQYKFLAHYDILDEKSRIDTCIEELKDCKKLLGEVQKIKKEVKKFGKLFD